MFIFVTNCEVTMLAETVHWTHDVVATLNQRRSNVAAMLCAQWVGSV